MEDTCHVGLLHVLSVELQIVALIVALDEAMRSDSRWPSVQSKLKNDYVSGAYKPLARVGCQGNRMSHLLLTLLTPLQEAQVDISIWEICDVSLQAFAYQTWELAG